MPIAGLSSLATQRAAAASIIASICSGSISSR